MTARHAIWGVDDHARRQRISQEVQQLKQLSRSLRTTAMRSFMKRMATTRTDAKTSTKPPDVAARSTAMAA